MNSPKHPFKINQKSLYRIKNSCTQNEQMTRYIRYQFNQRLSSNDQKKARVRKDSYLNNLFKILVPKVSHQMYQTNQLTSIPPPIQYPKWYHFNTLMIIVDVYNSTNNKTISKWTLQLTDYPTRP